VIAGSVGGADPTKGGLLDGHPEQVLTQLIGIGAVIVFDAVVSFILLKLVDLAIGLRVDAETEIDGLDLALHGEVVP
jgi:Amt family ammonium transporter